ncbi:MAG: hypothetical protein WCS97_01830 [Candidatus Paceibacterota bacterium]|jgi:hypothetical protein
MKKRVWVWVIVAVCVLFVSQAEARTLYLNFDPSRDERQAFGFGYRVYVGTTSESVANKKVHPIDIGRRHSYCLEVSDNTQTIFIGISAYSKMGIVSDVLWKKVSTVQTENTLFQGGKVVAHRDVDCKKEFVIVPSKVEKESYCENLKGQYLLMARYWGSYAKNSAGKDAREFATVDRNDDALIDGDDLRSLLDEAEIVGCELKR